MRPALRAKRVDSRAKPRGGATCACPACGGRTRVYKTHRRDPLAVERERVCVAPGCAEVFLTLEVPLAPADAAESEEVRE